MIVVDTKEVAYLLHQDMHTPAAEALLQVLALQEQAERPVVVHEEVVQSDRVLQLVLSNCCSCYDCEFVAAAQQLGVPLVTADRALLVAFHAVAQPLPLS